MTKVKLINEKSNQSLIEYAVGRATQSCEYPGIAQCFAIAGRRQSFMACTHVSPMSTAEELSEIFAKLRDIGGNWVTTWQLVGPFVDHFNVRQAQWKSVQDIRNTFTQEFGDTGANHYIMDISKQRHHRVLEDGFTIKTEYSFVNVKAELVMADKKIRFSYQGDRGVRDWNRLAHRKFKRF